MKKILTVSLMAVMAVSAARAEIASTAYVDEKTGDIATLETTAKTNLTAAVNELAADIESISGQDGILAKLDLTEVKKEGKPIVSVSQENGQVSASVGQIGLDGLTDAVKNNFELSDNKFNTIDDAELIQDNSSNNTKFPTMAVVTQMIGQNLVATTEQIKEIYDSDTETGLLADVEEAVGGLADSVDGVAKDTVAPIATDAAYGTYVLTATVTEGENGKVASYYWELIDRGN